jgi:PhoH-like ATPase
MTAIHSFPGNDVVIPLTVLDELDRFKDKPGLLGESARYVNRYMDELRGIGSLVDEVKIPECDQTLRVEIDIEQDKASIPFPLNHQYADNLILATAVRLNQKSKKKLKVITKDINLRVKCDALGLVAEDYYRDHVDVDQKNIFTGQIELGLPDSTIDKIYNTGVVNVEEVSGIATPGEEIFQNQLIVGKSPTNSSVLCTYKGDEIKLLAPGDSLKTSGVEPRNKEQKFALQLLNDKDIQLVSITGLAGSGKTFLALLAAMNNLTSDVYKRIVFTRSIQPVGRDLGYLPGDMNEKMDPWLAPIMDNFRHAFGDMTYFEMMREKGTIDIAPLSYIRGRTFNDSFVIVDEAQNTTIHELKTIITRVGKGSKIVLLGDIDQVDTPYIDTKSNGLTIVVEKFKESPFAGHIQLTRGQRSDIATIAANIL